MCPPMNCLGMIVTKQHKKEGESVQEELKQIKKGQTIILFCILMQSLMMMFQTIKINSLVTNVTILASAFTDFQNQFSVLITQLNDFIELFNTFSNQIIGS